MNKTIEYWKVKCDKCGYTWTSYAKLHYVSCPNCMGKTLKEKSNEDWKRINLKKRRKRRENKRN